ncbi:MAG TPA: FAD:protein FMN transferase [Clostridia bacterium]|nr:FAD:protein FMN transferase [Clostridia bacterium]
MKTSLDHRAARGLKKLAALLLLLPLLCACGCALVDGASGLSRYQASYLDVFDTATILTVYAPDEAQADAWLEETHALLLQYHRLYDIYNSYDGLSNARTVNENAGVAPVRADTALVELVLYAKDMYALTGGRMNIALGSVLSIWHEYREAGLENPDGAQLPPMEALEEAARHADIEDVVVDEAAGTIYLADPKMSLDLGAIAKGYAAQKVANEMEKRGVSSMLLSVGGNVVAIGARTDGKDWKVEVQSPYGGEALYLLNVNGLSVVTSGSYQRYYTVDGARYHHIIDPATLMPALYYDSVTVLSADSSLADALSTALFCLPPEESQALATRAGVDVLWVATDGAQTMTEGFRAKLTN